VANRTLAVFYRREVVCEGRENVLSQGLCIGLVVFACVQACRWDTYRLAVRVSMTGGSGDEESIAKMLC
jgi:hypothetical protein